MDITKAKPPQPSTLQAVVNLLWPYVTGRRGLILLAVAVIAVGLALNWGALVAAGIAPLLLGALPCVAMCALGLCMNRSSGGSCGKDVAAPRDTPDSDTGGSDETRS